MAIGLAYGVRKISVPFKSNFAIALFSGFATLISSFLGNLLSNYIPNYIGNLIGGSIVGLIGIYTIISYLYNKSKSKKTNEANYLCFDNLKAVIDDPSIADKDYSGDISLKESILLGIALAANCLGTGFGAGMTGVNTLVLSGAVIVFSLLTISFGTLVGKRFASRFLGDKVTVISGLLLLVVGVYQMIV